MIRLFLSAFAATVVIASLGVALLVGLAWMAGDVVDSGQLAQSEPTEPARPPNTDPEPGPDPDEKEASSTVDTGDEPVSAPIVRRDPRQQKVREWIRQGEPDLASLRLGSVGRVRRAEILQIVDDRTALCQLPGGETVLVRGYNTIGAIDGQLLSMPLVWVAGTQQYTTVLGATKTVAVLEALGDGDVRAELAEEMAAERRERERMEAEREAARQAAEEERLAELRESQFRQWTSADGDFSIEARLDRLASGVVTLETRDGRRIEVDEDRLSTADRQYIPEESKRRRNEARRQRDTRGSRK